MLHSGHGVGHAHRQEQLNKSARVIYTTKYKFKIRNLIPFVAAGFKPAESHL